jgi:hypothetical protein
MVKITKLDDREAFRVIFTGPHLLEAGGIPPFAEKSGPFTGNTFAETKNRHTLVLYILNKS